MQEHSQRPLSASRPSRPGRGFALLELILVALILSILAAVVVPQLVSGRRDPWSTEVSRHLTTLRRAIELYADQHDELPDAALADRLTRPHQDGTGASLGPYLRRGVPANPFSGRRSVRAVTFMPNQPVGDEGWIYDTTTGDIRLNARGGPSSTERWFDY